MINYTDTNNLSKIVNIEICSLRSTLNIQRNLNKQILVFIKNFVGSMKVELDFDPNNKIYYYINEATSNLNKNNSNISELKDLLSKLDKITNSINNPNYSDILQDEIRVYNQQYNSKIDDIFNNTISIEKFIHEISLLDLSSFVKENENEASLIDNDSLEQEDIDLELSFVENTLIISEIKGKVFLPYKIEKVKEILLDNNDKYTSLDEVIRKVYTKPIRKYRFSAVSRFKEAYKLMIEREKSSKIKALTLASELFTNYNLHPAIITACETLDELDIYLTCLEDNELEDFHFFDIKYEIAPTISKKDKNIAFETIE